MSGVKLVGAGRLLREGWERGIVEGMSNGRPQTGAHDVVMETLQSKKIAGAVPVLVP